MRVKIIRRKVYLPKNVLEQSGIPENGECQAILVGDEIRLFRAPSESSNLSQLLREEPIRRSIKDIMNNEVIEDT